MATALRLFLTPAFVRPKHAPAERGWRRVRVTFSWRTAVGTGDEEVAGYRHLP
jgi:hypothetical protein